MIANSIPRQKTGNQSSSREPRHRSASPDHHNTGKQHHTDRSSSSKKPLFQAGTSGRVYSACAICLGHHPHKIIDCNVPTLWDKSLPTLALQTNKALSMRDGKLICADWQRVAGCTSSCHDNHHICSGCTLSSHGAQDCPRAEKV